MKTRTEPVQGPSVLPLAYITPEEAAEFELRCMAQGLTVAGAMEILIRAFWRSRRGGAK